MSNETNCPKCGAPLPSESVAGVCPKCLLELAMAEDVEVSGSGVSGSVASESPVADNTGKRFGDYELLEEVARGGMGVVYKARQRSLDRIVAIKMILAGQFATREFIQRFRTEAAAAAALRHPNIVAIHEVGMHDGQHFFSMDYVEGRDLSETVRDSQFFTIYDFKRSASWAKTIAEAVHYAHQQGILHRDLKPANVLIDAHDQPHITDFGLAKRFVTDTATAFFSFGPKLTFTGEMLGSPSYMPPEQATSNRGKVGPYSDVYALGAILYDLITGRPPFRGETPLDTVRLSLETEPIAPRLLNSKVPLDLETICLKCLRKAPPHRYATARELAEDLDRFLTGKPIAARPISTVAKIWRWCRRRAVVASLSAAVGVLLIILTVGSTIAAYRFQREAQKTKDALRQTYVTEARLRGRSGEVGQRFRTLETLTKAAAIGIGSPLELRNEAIKAMALPDLRERQSIECPTGAVLRFDATASLYFRRDRNESSAVSVRGVSDGREIGRVPVPGPPSHFYPVLDGRFLLAHMATSNSQEIYQVWDVAQRAMIFQTNLTARAGPASFRSDGLAAFGLPDGHVQLYDLNQQKLVESYELDFPANVLRFDPRNRYLVVSAFGSSEVRVLDVRQHGKIVERLRPPGWISGGVDWSSDGRLLAVSASGPDRKCVVQVWDWTGGQPRAGPILRGYQNLITDLRFLPQSDFVMGTSWGNSPWFWSAESGEPVLLAHLSLAMFDIHSSRLAFQSTPTEYRIQDFVANREFQTFYGEPGSSVFGGMDLSPDGSLLALGAGAGVRLWHIHSRTLIGVVPEPAGTVRFHPADGSLIVVGEDRVVRRSIHSSLSGDEIVVGAPEILSSSRQRWNEFPLAMGQNGLKLACAADGRVEIVDWRDPSQSVVLNHGQLVKHVSLSSDGALAVTAGGGFKVWDVAHRRLIRTFDLIGYPFSSFSPDDRWLVLSTRGASSGVGGGSHQIYRGNGWQLVKEIPLDDGPWTPSCFSPDGRLLALRVKQSAIRLFETEHWTEIATLEAPTQDPFSWFTFSRDGTVLAVACDNHTAQLWNLRAIREQLARIDLDWSLPPYSPQKPAATIMPKVVVNPR